jgi:endonuclease YncB( thermonuclease family)
MGRFSALLVVYFLVSSVCLSSQSNWQTLSGCRLVEHVSNDGDSVHVKHGGKEYIFRLLYVDTPERKSLGLTERTTAQAKSFQVLKRDLYLMAEEAAALTAQSLKKPFTVQTQWEDARGDSTLPRHYAVLTTAEGRDLAELLVESGLARIYGRPVMHPDGRSGKEVVAVLEEKEVSARTASRGIWAFSRGKK